MAFPFRSKMTESRPPCEKCPVESQVTVQASGHFCQNCFLEYFRQKFRRIMGASRLIYPGNVVVLAFDGSKASQAVLDILSILEMGDNSNPKYKKKNKYASKVLHISLPNQPDISDKVKQRLESTSLESEIFKVTETDFERIKNENRKIERFGDSTESIYNEKNALEQIIIDKSKEMGAQFVIDASTVDKVAADAMTNLVLGFGRELNLTAGFSQKMENDVTILRPFREVTQIEVEYYCKVLELENLKEKKESIAIDTVHHLSSKFMTDLALQGQKSNPSAIVKIADKIKPKD